MRLARMWADGPDGPELRIVTAGPDGGWIDVRRSLAARLREQGAAPERATALAAEIVPASLTSALQAGALFSEALEAAAAAPPPEAVMTADGRPAGGPRWAAPVDPPQFRDFMAFREHFEAANRRRNRDVPDVMYEIPVAYLGNAGAIVGPDTVIPWPRYSERLDYELELGIVVGRPGRNLDPERAIDHVLGVTLLNDFSARDIQLREMTALLGPSKGKHFATALGPVIVSLGDLPTGGVEMTARVNGELWSSGSSGSIMWSIGELVAWASTAEVLPAGAVLGTGTVGGGCGLDLGRFLRPGDVVELEATGIGVLRNTVGQPERDGWIPTARRS